MALLHRLLLAPRVLDPLVHGLRHIFALLHRHSVTVLSIGGLLIPLEGGAHDLRGLVIGQAADETAEDLAEAILERGELLGEANNGEDEADSKEAPHDTR